MLVKIELVIITDVLLIALDERYRAQLDPSFSAALGSVQPH